MKKFKLLVLPVVLSMFFCSTIFWGLGGVINSVDSTISSVTDLAGYAEECEKLNAQKPDEFKGKIKTIIEKVENFFSQLNNTDESSFAAAKQSMGKIVKFLSTAGTPEQHLSFTAACFIKSESNTLRVFFNAVAKSYPQFSQYAYHLANVYLVIERYNAAAISELQAKIKYSSNEEVAATLEALKEKADELSTQSTGGGIVKFLKNEPFKRELTGKLAELKKFFTQNEQLVLTNDPQVSFFNPIGHNCSLIEKKIRSLQINATLQDAATQVSSGVGAAGTAASAQENTGFEGAVKQAITLFSQVKEHTDEKTSPEKDHFFKKLDELVTNFQQLYAQIDYVSNRPDEPLSKRQFESLIVGNLNLREISKSDGKGSDSDNNEKKKQYLVTLKAQIETVLENAPVIYARKIKKFDETAADNLGTTVQNNKNKPGSGNRIEEIKELLSAAQVYCFNGEKKDGVIFSSIQGRRKIFEDFGKGHVSARLPYDENKREKVHELIKRLRQKNLDQEPIFRVTSKESSSSTGGKAASDARAPETKTGIITEGTVEETAEVVFFQVTRNIFKSSETPGSSGSSGSSTGELPTNPSGGAPTGAPALSEASYHNRLMELILELYERDMHKEIYLENKNMQRELADELNMFFTRLAKKQEKYQTRNPADAQSRIQNYYQRLLIKIGSYAGTMPLIDILRGLYTTQAQPETVVELADISGCKTIDELKAMVGTLCNWYKYQFGFISKLDYIKLLAPTVLMIGLMMTGNGFYASTAKSFLEKLTNSTSLSGQLPQLANYLQTSGSFLSFGLTGASLVSGGVAILPLMLWGMVVGYLSRPYLMMAVKQLRGMLVKEGDDGWYAFTIDTTLNMLSVVAIGWLTQITSQFAGSAYNEYMKEEQPFALEDPNDQCLAPIIRESSGDVHHDINRTEGYLAEVNVRIKKLRSLVGDGNLSEFQKAGAQEELKAYEAMKTDADAYKTTLLLQAHELAKEKLNYRIARRRAEQERIAQESWNERERLIAEYNDRQDRFALLQEAQKTIDSGSNETLKTQFKQDIEQVNEELGKLDAARKKLDTELFNDPKLKAVADAQNNLRDKIRAARNAALEKAKADAALEKAKHADEKTRAEAALEKAKQAKAAADEAAKAEAEKAKNAAKKIADEAKDEETRIKANEAYQQAHKVEEECNIQSFFDGSFLVDGRNLTKMTLNDGTRIYIDRKFIDNSLCNRYGVMTKQLYKDVYLNNKLYYDLEYASNISDERAIELAIKDPDVDQSRENGWRLEGWLGRIIGAQITRDNEKVFVKLLFEDTERWRLHMVWAV